MSPSAAPLHAAGRRTASEYADKISAGGLFNAISQFQFACLGSYSGPSMPMNLLGELVGAVDGIAPENLVKNTVAAVGGNRPKEAVLD